MHSSTTFALAVVGAAAAATVPDVTDFSGDVGTFDVTATSGPASGINWANFTVENTKLGLQTACNWAYNFDGPNPNITLGTKTKVVLFLTECDTPDFALYWGNASQSIQIDYNTTLTSRPVSIVASDGLVPTQDCSDSTCSASGSIGINEVDLLDESGASDPDSQYGYWDVTYRNFTSSVQEGYATEDFTFAYSGGGSASCSKTVTAAGAAPNSFCSGELEVQFETAVAPERSISVNSTVEIDATNTTVVGSAPIRGVCYIQTGGLVCEDRLRVQVSEATA
ncbi:diaminopimelate decarboxylase [Diplodia corticola]|uniref:Diaminopimelate decarboxylase n=1 Tax=Diplodia corticola TaxID=236234 RepID=A0A1J9QVU2_9PEZI|nr:diaminopimelate decarboxylase [Diplodia corticola]OJD33110.1 diaminopimelate decarboxylase [Diplodia corticola]